MYSISKIPIHFFVYMRKLLLIDIQFLSFTYSSDGGSIEIG